MLVVAIGETEIDVGLLSFAQGAISEACKVFFRDGLNKEVIMSHMKRIIEQLKCSLKKV